MNDKPHPLIQLINEVPQLIDELNLAFRTPPERGNERKPYIDALVGVARFAKALGLAPVTTRHKSSRESPSGPRAGFRWRRYMVIEPDGCLTAAVSVVIATTVLRPSSNQSSPVSS